MKHEAHQVIRDAIESGYGGLTGDEYLAAKIIRGQGRTPIHRLKSVMVAVVMVLVLTGVAFALTPRKYAVLDSGTWTYVDNQILYQGAEDKRPTVVLEKEGIRNMAVDSVTGMLYYITRAKGGGYTLDNVTNYGRELYPPKKINGKYRVIHDFVVHGSTMHLLADTSTGNGEIYRMETYSDVIPDTKLVISGWENKGTTAFSIWENTLYAYNGKTMMLSTIDLTTFSLVNEPVLAGELTAITAGYELDGERYVFALSGQKLIAIGAKSGKKMNIDAVIPADSASLTRDSYTLFVGDSAGELKSNYHITDLSGREMRQLYIVDFVSSKAACDVAEQLFLEKYPDVEIIHRWTNGGIDYKTEMMSGEPGIDIVCFQEYYTDVTPLPMLLKSGAILDLTDEPHIQAMWEDYRDLRKLVSVNGRQYGVPTSVQPALWEVDVKLAEKIGWEIPDGVWTWDDFDALIDLAITYNETADVPLGLLMDQGGAGYAINQFDALNLNFIDGTTGYDKPEYLALLQRIQKMAQHGLFVEWNINDDELNGTTLLRVDDHCVLRTMTPSHTYILPPAYDAENPAYVATVTPMVINANTKLKEEALYFLACYASVEATRHQYYYNFGQWLKDKSLYVPEDPAALAFTGYASPENEEIFNYALEYSYPGLAMIEVWRTQFFELIPALKAGEITPEEYVAIVQRQADMIMGE